MARCDCEVLAASIQTKAQDPHLGCGRSSTPSQGACCRGGGEMWSSRPEKEAKEFDLRNVLKKST